mmetsp:Transcript_51982/g.104261  ORF Transcript_51982/g.104261 Transcript_51982/m.104261 type:complete len:447 (+) Transcript_51982:177-1517(+)|eukprot:CAMPEP_0171635472 /NCGR_PEP_ID=MMETSP0990-20121206/26695_1 /TAXON_ID=483369 /ORGANISM="non described non described, Strain CCMP2098" /LENGTH=446 /DNA_ID=CAMNT_0012207139 /DNA_START=251 /DNA_END=1591 /DNA_ORIENTATION=+
MAAVHPSSDSVDTALPKTEVHVMTTKEQSDAAAADTTAEKASNNRRISVAAAEQVAVAFIQKSGSGVALYVTALSYYVDLGSDCLVLVQAVTSSPAWWWLFGITLFGILGPTLFFTWQCSNYAHIFKSCDLSVRGSVIEAMSFTLPLVSVYKFATTGEKPNMWRTNLFNAARSFCASVPTHMYLFPIAVNPNVGPQLRNSVTFSCWAMYISTSISALNYHFESGEPTNLQKYRIVEFKDHPALLLLLMLSSAVQSYLKLVGPSLVYAMWGLGAGGGLLVAVVMVYCALHVSVCARIRGMGWDAKTGKTMYRKLFNATVSAVMQRYLLDLGFMRAPNALTLCQWEGICLIVSSAVCSLAVGLRFSQVGDYIGLRWYLYTFWACLGIFVCIRIFVARRFKNEFKERTDNANAWLDEMKIKRLDLLKSIDLTGSRSSVVITVRKVKPLL